MKLTLICKGGINNGLGHLHRAISFFETTKGQAEYTLIAIIDRGLESLFRNIHGVHFVYKDEDVPSVLSSVPSDFKVCLLDMTELAPAVCKEIRNRFERVISLSPIFSDYGMLDMLFTRFTDGMYPARLKVFSGLPYAVFNTHCINISDEQYRRNLQEESLSIGISMGGVDAPNKSLQILQTLSKLDFDCTFFVLLGEGYAHSYQDMVDAIRQDTRHEIVLAKSNRSMWRILSNCSLAILAGGLTSFEAIYAGLPCLNIFEKSIHRDIVSGDVLEKAVSINLGLFNEHSLQALRMHVSELHTSREKLLQMRNNAKGLLDKEGPQRTLERIKEAFLMNH